MLLYLKKHSRLNLANATRELSKANNSAIPETYEELLGVIKYVVDTKNLGHKIKPKRNPYEPWDIVCFSNSDYVGDL